MTLAGAFFKLVRWPNLVFIALTQCMFYYLIAVPLFAKYNSSPILTPTLFWWMLIASVFIAAAGYIINDYFDLNIDQVNKPHKLVVDKIIKRRWAIALHLMLSSMGILISTWVCISIREVNGLLVAFINFISVIALWLYSTTYKRKLLVGNVLISLLTAWVILILYMLNLKSPFFLRGIHYDDQQNYALAIKALFKLTILYAGFAFILSLIREVIKDMEDMEGDAKYGCKTMPIVWGIPASKVFTGVWLIVLIASLSIVQYYALQRGWWGSVVYSVILIILPLIWILQKLYQARVPSDYHRLSSVVKAVMLTGILSMVFFRLYS